MKKSDQIKRRIFYIIQIGNKTDFPSTCFDVAISFMIVLSISATFLRTFENLAAWMPVLKIVEFFTIIVFLIEYVLRLWTAEYLYPEIGGRRAALRFAFSFYGVVDFLTIFSYFAPFLFSNGVVALRMLRVVRIMRLFKLNSTYDAFNVITDVLKDKKNQIISSVFLISVLLMTSSLCMYSLEHEAQPENFKNAFSGIWWSVSTMLTVGYGDIYPVTVGGKIFAIIIAFLGVGLVAIPTGIISAGFVEYYTKVKTGSYMERTADFVALDMTPGHEYIGKRLCDIRLPKGLFFSVLLRDEDVLTPYPALEIRENDSLLIASTSNRSIYAAIQEVTLWAGHNWIEKRIKDIDISRRVFIVMIKREDVIIKPHGNTVLKEKDKLLLLDRRI